MGREQGYSLGSMISGVGQTKGRREASIRSKQTRPLALGKAQNETRSGGQRLVGRLGRRVGAEEKGVQVPFREALEGAGLFFQSPSMTRHEKQQTNNQAMEERGKWKAMHAYTQATQKKTEKVS